MVDSQTTTSTQSTGLVEAIRFDLVRLHESWMSLFFPRQRDAQHSVLGKWKPRTRTGKIGYGIWGSIGAVVVVLLYPFVLLGFMTRFYTRQLDRTATSIGIIGVLLLSLIGWGGLTIVAHYRFSYNGFLSVAAAAGIATISAVLAVIFARIDGRFTTVLFAYPLGMTALFLPPVVAALYSPTLARYIFPGSDLLAIWLLDNVLTVGGLNMYLRAQFNLVGIAYVGMWSAIAIPLGWFLGFIVTLAEVVRPSPDE